MTNRKRILLLIIIMIFITTTVTGIAFLTLYKTAFEQQSERLVETTQSQARLLEAVARFDEQYSTDDVPGGAFEATLSQIKDAHKHYDDLGKSVDFALAKRDGNLIVFLLSHRHYDLENPDSVSFDSEIAEPMRRALSGESGTVVGLDYRGVMVLTAYEPVKELNLGIVAKIDLSKIREPFINTGLLTGGVTISLIILGIVLFQRIANPLIKSIEESEKKYRTLFESASDAIFIHDFESHFLEVNQVACGRLGYSHEELLTMTPMDINSPDYAILIPLRIEKLKKENFILIESTHVTKDGRTIPVEINSRKIDYGGKQAVLSIARDITERKRAEEALHQSEAQLNEAQRLAHIGSYQFDVHEGEIICSKETFNIVGINPQQGKPTIEEFMQIVHPDDSFKVLRKINMAFRKSKPYDLEYRIIDKKGVLKHIHSIGKPLLDENGVSVKIFGTMMDITARKKAKEALAHERDLMHSLLENSHDFIYFKDKDYRFHRVSKTFTDLFQCKYEDIIGKTDNDLFPKEIAEETLKEDRQVIEKGIPIINKVQGGEVRDGKKTWVLTTKLPWIDKNGDTLGLFGISRNITELKKAEEMLTFERNKFNSILDQLPVGVSVLDSEDKYIYINPVSLKIERYNKKVSSLIGKDIRSNHPSKSIPVIEKLLHDFKTGEESFFSSEIKRGDNIIEISYHSIISPKGEYQGLVRLSSDITEKKMAEEALKKAHDELEIRVKERTAELAKANNVLNAINTVFKEALECETDEELTRTCLTVAEELTGSKFGFIGKLNQSGLLDKIAWSETKWKTCKMKESEISFLTRDMELRGIWSKVLKDGKSLLVNNPASHPDSVGSPKGHPLITSFLGIPLKRARKTIGIIALANKESGYDIVDQETMETLSVAIVEALDRKHVEEEVRKNKEHLGKLHDSLEDVIFIVKLPERKIEFVNRSLEMIFGYMYDECIGQLTKMLYPSEEEYIKFGKKIERVLEQGKDIFHSEQLLKRKNGDIFPSEITTTFLKEGKGITRVISSVRDITKHKQMLETLQQAKEYSESLIESSLDMIISVNMKRKIIEFNHAAEKTFGYTKNEVLGKHVNILYANSAWGLKVHKATLNDGEFKGEILNKRKNGETFISYLSSSVLRDATRTVIGIMGISHDITKRKQVEEELKKREAFNFALFQYNPMETIVVDRECKITMTNLAKAISDDRLPGIGDIMYRDYAGKHEIDMHTELMECIRTDEVKKFPERKYNDKFLSITISPFPDGAIIISENITQRKQDVEALRKSEAGLANAQRIAHLGNWDRDILKNKLYWSDEIYRIFGVTSQEFEATYEKLLHYVHPEDKEYVQRSIDEAINGEKPYNIDFRIIRQDGSERIINSQGEVIFDKSGKAIRISGTALDITERKQAEEALRKSEAGLINAQRLASIGTLAAGISHEINQPLNALKLKVDGMLYWGEREPETLKENLEKNLRNISEQAERIEEIIKQVRVLAGQEKSKDPLPLNISKIVKRVFSLMKQRMYSHGIKVEFNLDDSLPVVYGYPTQMEQVIINLLINAINALDTLAKKDKKILITTEFADDNCILEILDNGPGIPEEDMNQIFDPFFTSNINGEGMGFGLSIIQNIITGMGGTIIALNCDKGGALFKVSIPVSSKEESV